MFGWFKTKSSDESDERLRKIRLSDRLAFDLNSRLLVANRVDISWTNKKEKRKAEKYIYENGDTKDIDDFERMAIVTVLAEENDLSAHDILSGWHRVYGQPLLTELESADKETQLIQEMIEEEYNECLE
jgi:hypothetical protein